MTDLPETVKERRTPGSVWGLTWDERARGSGGYLASCGEENLLALPDDRYAGQDICKHEFAHAIRMFGLSRRVAERFDQQFRDSTAKGIWITEYAGTNTDEYFAVLTCLYFGGGRKALKESDPASFTLFDEFYSGRLSVADFEPDPPKPGHP